MAGNDSQLARQIDTVLAVLGDEVIEEYREYVSLGLHCV